MSRRVNLMSKALASRLNAVNSSNDSYMEDDIAGDFIEEEEIDDGRLSTLTGSDDHKMVTNLYRQHVSESDFSLMIQFIRDMDDLLTSYKMSMQETEEPEDDIEPESDYERPIPKKEPTDLSFVVSGARRRVKLKGK